MNKALEFTFSNKFKKSKNSTLALFGSDLNSPRWHQTYKDWNWSEACPNLLNHLKTEKVIIFNLDNLAFLQQMFSRCTHVHFSFLAVISDMILQCEPSLTLRFSGKGLLVLPKVRTKTYGKASVIMDPTCGIASQGASGPQKLFRLKTYPFNLALSWNLEICYLIYLCLFTFLCSVNIVILYL